MKKALATLATLTALAAFGDEPAATVELASPEATAHVLVITAVDQMAATLEWQARIDPRAGEVAAELRRIWEAQRRELAELLAAEEAAKKQKRESAKTPAQQAKQLLAKTK